MSEDIHEPQLSTDEILRIGRNFQNTDTWRGETFETAKLLCDEIERLAWRLGRIEDQYATVMKILRGVKLYPQSLNPHDDDFGRRLAMRCTPATMLFAEYGYCFMKKKESRREPT